MSSPKIRLAINGFGRIGRAAFRIAFDNPALEIVAINDLAPADALAMLLQYDTVYRTYGHKVVADGAALVVEGKKIPVFSQKDPAALPWKDLAVDVVLECTGAFTKKKDASAHLTAGAKAVVISAPGKEVPTYVRGVNDGAYAADQTVISNASCTTNCITPVMWVLDKHFGIDKAMMSTIHAYTNDQMVLDVYHKKDPRRARAAAQNIIPTTTGAATATAEVMPQLKGKFDGVAFRVPVAVGSLSDFTVVTKKDVSIEEVNAALSAEAGKAPLQGIMEVTTDPIVSSDVIGTTCSSLVDLSLTNVVGGNLVKVVAWYDNEWGYSHRLVEMAGEVGQNV